MMFLPAQEIMRKEGRSNSERRTYAVSSFFWGAKNHFPDLKFAPFLFQELWEVAVQG